MKLVCTASLVNRAAEMSGFGRNSQLNKPVKSVLQFRNLPYGGKQILLSTTKDVSGQRFNVDKVGSIRDKFIDDGMLTIEMNEPLVNIMIKKANPAELKQFLTILRGQPELGVVKGAKGPVKRARSPEISKIETASIKKHLKKNDKSLVIRTRKDYPLNFGFPSELVDLTIKKINLKKIDSRILALNNLAVLDLSDNIISSVDKLKLLKSSLQRLTLANNQIQKLEQDFFLCKAFEGLRHLDLRGNQLTMLPNSLVYLTKLQSLVIADNKLEYLPYNMHFLGSLQTLKAQNNKLPWIPKSILNLRLIEADVSANPILPDRTNWPTSHFGSTGISTLFEIAAESVLNHNLNSPGKAFFKLGTSDLPQIIRDYLDRAKKCDRCQKLSIRYSFKMHDEPAFLIAQQVIGTNRVRVKGVNCHACANRSS